MQPSSTTKTQRRQARPHLFIVVALIALALDQWSKWWVRGNMPLYSDWAPFPSLVPYFQFTHITNTGMAFGLLDGLGSNVTRIAFTVLAVTMSAAIFHFNYQEKRAKIAYRIALGLILSGALGNLIDRLHQGFVTDFAHINLRSIINIALADWYIWNIADLAVVSGAIILGIIMFTDPDFDDTKSSTKSATTSTSSVTGGEK